MRGRGDLGEVKVLRRSLWSRGWGMRVVFNRFGRWTIHSSFRIRRDRSAESCFVLEIPVFAGDLTLRGRLYSTSDAIRA